MGRVKPFAVVSALLLAIVAVGSWSTPAGANVSSPPWEPDAASIGSLRFYSGRADLLTSGPVSAAPFAAYAEASVDGAPGDDFASLWAFTPVQGEAPSSWPGERLTGPSSYPNPNAHPRVNGTVLPVASGQTGDLSLAAYIARHPNNATSTGYANVYQLRLYTWHSGGEGTTYSSTDVAVDADIWTQIYPEPDTTTMALAVSPAQWTPGIGSVALVAKLTPATVGGTVSFYDGERMLGSLPGFAIQASLNDVGLGPGRHVLRATFLPDTPYRTSSSSVVYQIGALASGSQATTTTLTVSPPGPEIDEGTTVTFTAIVDPDTARGTISFYDGSKRMAIVPLYRGSAAYATTALAPSEHPHLSALYAPSSSAFQASRSPYVRLKVVKRSVADRQNISVLVPGTKVKGKTIVKGILGRTELSVILFAVVGGGSVFAGVFMRRRARRRGRQQPAVGFEQPQP